MDKRKSWLDAARGIAMLFVIFGHIGNEVVYAGKSANEIFGLIAAFTNPVKVPLFFAISGYLFSSNKTAVQPFVKKMLVSRLLPYAIWASFMGIAAFCVDFAKTGFEPSKAWGLLCENYIIPFLKGNLIWFIPCLIVTEIIFYAINRLSFGKTTALAGFTVLCTVLGYILSANSTVKPWKIDTALTCVQFMFLGNMLKKLEPKLKKKNSPLCCGAAMIAYILMLILCGKIWNGCTVNVNMGEYFNPVAFTVLAFVGIFAFFELSKLTAKVKPLVFVGKNTFIYFVWHMYAAKTVILLYSKTPLFKLADMSLNTVVLCAAACVLVWPVCVVVNKYFGFSVGKKKVAKGSL